MWGTELHGIHFFYGFRAVDDVLRFRLLSPHLFCWEVEAVPETSISSPDIQGSPQTPYMGVSQN